MGFSGLNCLFNGLGVHPGHHEDFSGADVLGNGRDKPLVIKLESAYFVEHRWAAGLFFLREYYIPYIGVNASLFTVFPWVAALTGWCLAGRLSHMPKTIIERSETQFLQVINEKGEADASLMPSLGEADFKRFFETMLLARAFNNRALSLQREGRIGTYASIWGQEASQIGSALAFNNDDWIFPTFRESGVFVAKGYPMWMLYRYWAGDERGMQIPPEFNLFPMSVPVGTQIPHATGAAWAMKLKGHKKVAAVYFGDGGSSKGDFYEGLNFAGVNKVPAVFLCQNNQWAISVPRSRQTAAKTIAQKAAAFGFEGVQVDGNDIAAVYKVTKDAVDKARSGGGPTLIECFTYRLHAHTTADAASRDRTKGEGDEWTHRDPLLRLKLFMEKKGRWTEEYGKEADKKAAEEVDGAIKEAESYGAPDPADIIGYTYGELTGRQKKELKDL